MRNQASLCSEDPPATWMETRLQKCTDSSVALKHTCSRFSRRSFFPSLSLFLPSSVPFSLALPVSLNILSAWRQAAVTGQRIATRWRAMRAVSSGLAAQMGFLGDALVNVKYNLTRRAALYYSHILSSEKRALRLCVHSTVHMYVCVRNCLCFL